MLAYILVTILLQSSFALHPAIIQLTEPVDHGEGPVWDERTELLYFVDMFNGKLKSYNINTEEQYSVSFEGNLTLAVPSNFSESRFIVGLDRKVVEIEWNGQNDSASFLVLTSVDTNKPLNRLNDGKADKEGRLWFGTMGFEIEGEIIDIDQGSLYFITNENLINPEIRVNPVNISNGMAWNLANDKFYFIDTTSGTVKEYDYNNEFGHISNERIVFDVSNYSQITGKPDGMTIDVDNNLWIALYGGGVIVKVNPEDKELLQIIAIPAKYTTSVCWGGSNFDILFVTTSRYLLNEEQRKEQPAAGSVFTVVNLGTSGFQSYKATVTAQQLK